MLIDEFSRVQSPANIFSQQMLLILGFNMKNKRIVFYSLPIIVVVAIYFLVQGQQKNGTNPANFSGEWRSKESISMGGNIVCCLTRVIVCWLKQ